MDFFIEVYGLAIFNFYMGACVLLGSINFIVLKKDLCVNGILT